MAAKEVLIYRCKNTDFLHVCRSEIVRRIFNTQMWLCFTTYSGRNVTQKGLRNIPVIKIVQDCSACSLWYAGVWWGKIICWTFLYPHNIVDHSCSSVQVFDRAQIFLFLFIHLINRSVTVVLITIPHYLLLTSITFSLFFIFSNFQFCFCPWHILLYVAQYRN